MWLKTFTALVAFAMLALPMAAVVHGDDDGNDGAAPIVAEPDTAEQAKPNDAVADGDNAFTAESSGRYESLIAGLTIFVLAVFVGFEIITKVPPTLHTPLMSGSNAISGISLVGAVLVTGAAGFFSSSIGVVAVVLATINVVGGFLVTHRMLAMFAGKKKRPAKT